MQWRKLSRYLKKNSEDTVQEVLHWIPAAHSDFPGMQIKSP